MIEITVYKDRDSYRGFRSAGHAEYAEEGQDIICAAVSVLSVNAVNSIEEFTDDVMDVAAGDGLIELKLEGDLSEGGQLLLRSFVLGIQAMQKTYGKEYIDLRFREV